MKGAEKIKIKKYYYLLEKPSKKKNNMLDFKMKPKQIKLLWYFWYKFLFPQIICH